jgi:hypothetical protein
MTPGLIVAAILAIGARAVTRGMDEDLTTLLAGSGALLLLIRLFAWKLSSTRY